MDMERDLKGNEQLRERAHELVQRLGQLHKDLRKLACAVEELEKEADKAHLVRVKLSMRAAYVRISQSGQSLVEAHLEMGVPPTAFEPEGSEE